MQHIGSINNVKFMLSNKISNRIGTLIDALGMNKNTFSKEIGLENNVTIGRIVNEDRSPSYEVINKILQTFGSVNANWLITGNGDMFLTPNMTPNMTPKHEKEVKSDGLGPPLGIPLIPIEAMAGFGSAESIQVFENQITERYVIPEFVGKVDFFIRVYGSSMYPKYNSGDIVACKRIESLSFVQWNKTYILDTTQGALVKRLIKSSVEGNIVCRSDNSAYSDFELNINEDINAIALIVGVIRFE